MKKRTLFVVMILVLVCVSLLFSCDSGTETTEENKVESLVVLSEHQGAYILGQEVDLAEITFSAIYTDESEEKVVLNDIMLSEEDRAKFFKKGIHTITVQYRGVSLPLQIVVTTEEEIKEYKVTFYSIGGTEVTPYSTTVVTAFPSPEREGYTFDGWYTNVSFNNNTTDIAYQGNRVKAPYTLTADTAFYAKWIDNRFCTVSFYGNNDEFLFSEIIHYGEAIDIDSYPFADKDGKEIVIPGKTFLGWTVTNGNPAKVTSDLIVKAGFLVDKCTVSIYYFNKENEVISVDNSYDYGTEFIYGNYTMPSQEGYDSRWVVYYNHSKKYVCPSCGKAEVTDYRKSLTCSCGETMIETGYSEMPDNTGMITLTHDHTLIQAYHVIKVYDISIRNGQTKGNYVDNSLTAIYGTVKGTLAYRNDKERLESEYETFLREANIKLESIYEDSDAKKNFSVQWGGSFDLSAYTQNPKLDTPANISDGYSSEWCYVVQDLLSNKDIWYNTKGQIWNEETQTFEEPDRAEGEGENYWILYNNPYDEAQKEYIATVRNGILTEIKYGVTIVAKYLKKQRTVAFRREYDSVKGVVAKFSVPFYSDFNLYDSLSYSDPSSYIFSPDRASDTDPAPDPIIRQNIALYEQVRLYELYQQKDLFDKLKTSTESDEIAAYYLWFYVNLEEIDTLYRIFVERNMTEAEVKVYDTLQNAMKNVYGDLFTDSDFISLYEYFSPLCASQKNSWFSESTGLKTQYNKYKDLFAQYGLGYDTEKLLSSLSAWDDFVQSATCLSCKNAWEYYADSEGYDFYLAQINLSKEECDQFYKVDLYLSYLADPTNPEKEIYQRYKSVYEGYKDLSSYIYYSFGLEGEESESKRVIRLCLIEKSSVEQFYLFSLTNATIQSYAETYYSTAENGKDDWSLEWYTNSEKTFDSKISFIKTDTMPEATLTVKDDITIYCTDIDNREYEFSFHYGYDFSSSSYTVDTSRVYSASTLWQNIYSNYFVVDSATGQFVPAGILYSDTETYYIYDKSYHESSDIAQKIYRGGTWTQSYSSFYTSSGSGKYNGATKSYNDEITYYSHYIDKTDSIVLYMDTILPTDYNKTVSRVVNDVILTYTFIGWYDVPYYSYLLTGYRGNSLKVTNSHTENIDFYAHYACDTEYTITIYDTTQSVAYNGIREYADGYSVADNTITYTLRAGTMLSLEELYKGTKTDEGNISGQTYYYAKRFLDYYNDYYLSAESLYNNMPSGLTVAQIDVLLTLYQSIISRYDEVTEAVKDHNYATFSDEEYQYYLSRYSLVRTQDSFSQFIFDGFGLNFTKTGDEYISDWHLFVLDYLSFLKDLSDKNYLDVSVLSSEFSDYLFDSFYQDATAQVSLFYNENPNASEWWMTYHANYYTKSGNVYTRVEDGTPYNKNQSYYTFIVTTDAEYLHLLMKILSLYKGFLQAKGECDEQYATYSLYTYHRYDDSMIDINAANGYDYEALGELKYNFINWYTNSTYTSVYNGASFKGYYNATESARLDQMTWGTLKDYYLIFDTTEKKLLKPTTAFDENKNYYTYDAVTMHASTKLVTEVVDSGSWTQCATWFYLYDSENQVYKPVLSTDGYSSALIYYSHYRDATTLIASHLQGWAVNYEKYYYYTDVTGYLKATAVYNPDIEYYQFSNMYWNIIISQDITIYAKWMDISRGSEGLVYELVEYTTDGKKGYIVVDYINSVQTQESYKNEYMYITTDDNGNIPGEISGTELQIPATITGYAEATALARSYKSDWANHYTDFYVYDTNRYAYVFATKVFDDTAIYYDIYTPIDYPVIGICADALDHYRSQITIINLPLNLYFMEEGSFNLCPIEYFTRAEARSGEEDEEYLVLDIDPDTGLGIALYQKNSYARNMTNHFASGKIPRHNGSDVLPVKANSFLSYAVANTIQTVYTLLDGTVYIADYAFRNSFITKLEYEDGTDLTAIGKYAFDNTSLVSVTIPANVKRIEQNAFYRSGYLTKITLQDNAKLSYIGEKAFYGTGWYKAQKGLVALSVNSYDPATSVYHSEEHYYQYIDGEYIEQSIPASVQSAWASNYMNYYVFFVKKYFIGINSSTAGGYDNYDSENENLIRYDSEGNKDVDGDYVGITSATEGDKILFLYPIGTNVCTRHTVLLSSQYILIAVGAFKGFDMQKLIIEAGSLQKIDDEAFMSCPLLTEIEFKNATDGVDIGNNIFSGKSFQTIIITDASGLVKTGEGWSQYD